MYPKEFIWGTAASSTQAEGAAPASDWYAWEREGKAPISGDGNGFATRYAEDFEILKSLGLDHHRLSIEWARIEPEEGQRDQAAIDHYRRIFEAADEAGISLWVCLHHFTLPDWFQKSGAFTDDAARDRYWRRHVELVAETFEPFGWQPINEPMAYAAFGYLSTLGPPGAGSFRAFQDATRGIYLAWRDAWEILGGDRPVATIHNLSPVHTLDDSPATRQMAEGVDHSTFVTPIRAHRDGVLSIIGKPDEEIPGLKGSADYFGFSYYSAQGVGRGAPMQPWPPGGEPGPLGYVPWSEGLREVLDRLHEELPGMPLMVVEHGIGTDDDTKREAFLRESLDYLEGALADGIDVRGFFHWTAVDNYEWLEGFDVRFGIIERDRTVKSSARILSEAVERSRQ